MKKNLIPAILMATFATTVVTSCNKESILAEEPIEKSVCFVFDNDAKGFVDQSTKFLMRTQNLGNCAIAMYGQTNGKLLATGYSESTSVTVEPAPNVSCYVFAVANINGGTPKWPESISKVKDMTGAFNYLEGTILRVNDVNVRTGESSIKWTPGQLNVQIQTAPLYRTVNIINQTVSGGQSISCVSLTKCPSEINLFSETYESDEIGFNDYLTEKELATLTKEGKGSVFVPYGVYAEIVIKGNDPENQIVLAINPNEGKRGGYINKSFVTDGSKEIMMMIDQKSLSYSWQGTDTFIWETYSETVAQYKELHKTGDDPTKLTIITSDGLPWEVTSHPKWCTVKKQNNELNIFVESNTPHNEANAKREGVITVKGCNGSQEIIKAIPICQAAPSSWFKFASWPVFNTSDPKFYPSSEDLQIEFFIKTTSQNPNDFKANVIAVKGNYPDRVDSRLNEHCFINNLKFVQTYYGLSNDEDAPFKHRVTVTIPSETLCAMRNIAGADQCILYLDFDDVHNSLVGNENSDRNKYRTDEQPKSKTPELNSGLPRLMWRIY